VSSTRAISSLLNNKNLFLNNSGQQQQQEVIDHDFKQELWNRYHKAINNNPIIDPAKFKSKYDGKSI